MIILAEQTGAERYNRQFEERNSYLEYNDTRINVPHRLERSLLLTLINAGRKKNPQRHLWQKVGPTAEQEQADFDRLLGKMKDLLLEVKNLGAENDS